MEDVHALQYVTIETLTPLTKWFSKLTIHNRLIKNLSLPIGVEAKVYAHFMCTHTFVTCVLNEVNT